MLPRPNAFADEITIHALATTLAVTLDAVNVAFAGFIPRDAIEAGMVEQILLLRHSLHRAIRDSDAPGLTPLQADRLRRTALGIGRQLERAAARLEKRQFQAVSQLPHQYWRDEPITAVGRYDERTAPAIEQVEPVEPQAIPRPDPLPHPAPQLAPIRAAEPLRRHDADDPCSDGDALYQLARMRIDADYDPAQLRALAERDARQAAARRGNWSAGLLDGTSLGSA